MSLVQQSCSIFKLALLRMSKNWFLWCSGKRSEPRPKATGVFGTGEVVSESVIEADCRSLLQKVASSLAKSSVNQAASAMGLHNIPTLSTCPIHPKSQNKCNISLKKKLKLSGAHITRLSGSI
jgi:hypothetical protein